MNVLKTEVVSRRDRAASEAFPGTVLIIAPHMDDEILACGGLMASLPQRERIHIVFATDGTRSPAPVLPWQDTGEADLGSLRRDESRRAAALLGVPDSNLHFLNLPEADLQRHTAELERLLLEHILSLRPQHVFVPFRYDRHPDHLAINHVVTAAVTRGVITVDLVEYFVYYRWRLLAQRDVRKYIDPGQVVRIDIGRVAALKRRALDCFTTQTTRFFDWQTRPILRSELLDEECAGPELFVRYSPDWGGARIFSGSTLWIRVAHRLEPILLRWKYILKSSVQRALGRHD